MRNISCGCELGNHLWDTEYEKGNNQRFCICCQHYFLTDKDENNACESAINLHSQTSTQQKTKKSKKNSFRRLD